MSTGALLLARLHDPEMLVPAADLLEDSDVVDCWNAVDGHVDLVAKLNGSPTQLLEELRNLRGEQELDVIELSSENGKLLCNPSFCYSFAFLEVESEKLDAVRDRLTAMEQVPFCSSRAGTSEIIAVVTGDTFQAVDRIVAEKIRPIDGVLRLKQDRVINLKQI
jgi:DNA-binding Lrp family transcriptional regulator